MLVFGTMQHRHLNHEHYTLAAVDDVIERGKRADWVALRRAVVADPEVRARVLKVCERRISDPYEQRFQLWWHYAQRRFA